MIEFKKLRYKNLLSTGNSFTELDLNSHKTSLVVGTNGSGKSTMLDALTFCLFGKPFRKITKNELINSVNGKKLLTEIEFSVGSKEYMIRRGVKPDVLEIFLDGEPLNKEASKAEQQKVIDTQILRMSYKTFCQVIIVGKTNYVAFMSLSAPERRTFIENLLDIEIFSRMNDNLKQRIRDNKDDVLRGERDRDIVKTKVEALKDKRDSITKIQEEQMNKLKEKALAERAVLQEAMSVKEDLQAKIETLKEGLEEEKLTNTKFEGLKAELNEIRAEIRDHKKPIAFLCDNDTCPTCAQNIDPDFKAETIKDHEDELKILEVALAEAEDKYDVLEAKREEFKKIHSEISDQERLISNEEYRMTVAKQSALSIKKEMETLKEQVELDFEAELLALAKEYKTAKEHVLKLYADKETYGIAYELLKDSGIKSQIIKQYVPVINKIINAYLAEMELFIDFSFDENFNESIQSRGKDSFKYNNFSEGEKLRIDSALLFTWRDISRMRNPVSTNLLIMDETLDASADHDCVQALYKIITKFTDTNLFIISHSDTTKEVFSESNLIKFSKNKGFSCLF